MEAVYHDEKDEVFCTARSLIGTHALWFAIIAFHIFLAITSMLGNTVILASLNKVSSLHPPSKILFRSLALTDFCVGILLEPLFVIFLMTVVNKSLNLCRGIVVFTLFTGQVLCLVSLFTLTAISVDRLLALLLGMRYRQVVSSKRILATVVCFWILSIGFATAVFWNKLITVYYIAIVVILCIIISTCCYIKIHQQLTHHQAQIQHVHQGQTNGHEPLNMARYRKTVSSALWVQLTLLACYLPMGIVTILVAVEGLTSPVLLVWTLSSTLVFFNSTLNPVLYCWKIREVRRAAIDALRQMWCCSSSVFFSQIWEECFFFVLD